MALVSKGNGEADDVRRKRKQSQLRLENDPEGPFAADEPVDWLVHGRVADGVLLEARATERVDGAIGQRDTQGDDMRSGGAVEKASRTGSVAGDGAANCDILLTRRIGGEEQAVGGETALEITKENARLHANRQVLA